MIPIKTPHIVERNAFTIFSVISVSFNFIEPTFPVSAIFPSGSSNILNTSGREKRPIRITTTSKPPVSSGLPYVKRGNPITGSCPKQAIRRLTTATREPLKRLSWESITTTESPKIATKICSGAPTIIAILASKGAHTNSARLEKNPPNALASVTRFKARPASPFFTRAFPSKAVGAEAGVPGIPTKTAGIEPPYTPPQYRPLRSRRAVPGFMV